MNQVETIITNAGPLISLGKLGCLEILADLFPIVHVPQAVFDETVTRGLTRRAPEAIRACLNIRRPVLSGSTRNAVCDFAALPGRKPGKSLFNNSGSQHSIGLHDARVADRARSTEFT